MLTVLPSDSSSGGGRGANKDGQDPHGPGQPASHLAMIVSSEDDFEDDPHQIIHTDDDYVLPYVKHSDGYHQEYAIPASVENF